MGEGREVMAVVKVTEARATYDYERNGVELHLRLLYRSEAADNETTALDEGLSALLAIVKQLGALAPKEEG